MTAPERLNVRPALIHPSRPRAPARTAKVRSNSDTSPQDSPPKMQNKPAFDSAADLPAAATLTLRPASSPTSHLAPIEIP
jgi:hypothetical protein